VAAELNSIHVRGIAKILPRSGEDPVLIVHPCVTIEPQQDARNVSDQAGEGFALRSNERA
jgi:hypothetical protein